MVLNAYDLNSFRGLKQEDPEFEANLNLATLCLKARSSLVNTVFSILVGYKTDVASSHRHLHS